MSVSFQARGREVAVTYPGEQRAGGEAFLRELRCIAPDDVDHAPPAPMLGRNVVVVDTPGINATDDLHAEIVDQTVAEMADLEIEPGHRGWLLTSVRKRLTVAGGGRSADLHGQRRHRTRQARQQVGARRGDRRLPRSGATASVARRRAEVTKAEHELDQLGVRDLDGSSTVRPAKPCPNLAGASREARRKIDADVPRQVSELVSKLDTCTSTAEISTFVTGPASTPAWACQT